MDLMEYKAKELFAEYGLPAIKGFVLDMYSQLEDQAANMKFPCMVKAQVMIGGRGKAGGIKSAANPEELRAACEAVMGMDICGHKVERLLVAPKVEIVREWYLSITLDRLEKMPVVIFSALGGVDIEQTADEHPDQIVKLCIDPLIGVQRYHAWYLVSKGGVDEEYVDPLLEVMKKLYDLFCDHKCMLCEINPLAVDDTGKLVAVDAKISVDDSALDADLIALRDELEREALVLKARKHRFLYIPCNAAGNISVISNGSGMLMSCIDIITREDMCVHSVLDLGGGATADRIKEAIRIILEQDEVRGLFINIFGGITRCDEVAGGVEQFMEQYGSQKLIVVRFEGTNKEKGLEILRGIGRENVVFADGLHPGVSALAERGMRQ